MNKTLVRILIVTCVSCSITTTHTPLTAQSIPAAENSVENIINNVVRDPSRGTSIQSTAPVTSHHVAGPMASLDLRGRDFHRSDCGAQVLADRSSLCPRCGVDSATMCCCDNGRWAEAIPIEFDRYVQGEYVGPHRAHHIGKYRIRVDDTVSLVYRLTRELIDGDYRLNVGDSVRVELELGDTETPDYDRELIILPDGKITLRNIGPVQAAGHTADQLRQMISEKSKKYYKFANWTVTPLLVETRLNDLRNTVDARAGSGGQQIQLRVSPDGTIQPPAIGSVCVQGLTLDELKMEIDERYTAAGFRGIEISPILIARAPTFVYVLGEVRNPGRYTLERPTTAMQSIALAGGWNVGGNLRQIVVFRRADDWRLIATKINLQGALMGNRPTPADEIFLRDADVILVPKSPIRRIDDAIGLIFTQGINQVIVPFGRNSGIFGPSSL